MSNIYAHSVNSRGLTFGKAYAINISQENFYLTIIKHNRVEIFYLANIKQYENT